jgi:hypothetical protein
MDQYDGHGDELHKNRHHAGDEMGDQHLGAGRRQVEAVHELAGPTFDEKPHRQAADMIEESRRQPLVQALIDRPAQQGSQVCEQPPADEQQQIRGAELPRGWQHASRLRLVRRGHGVDERFQHQRRQRGEQPVADHQRDGCQPEKPDASIRFGTQ